jgi:C-terminal processing protease CtpA/Prc
MVEIRSSFAIISLLVLIISFSLIYDINPRLDNLKKHQEDDGKEQIAIIANKIFAKQDIGVRFVDQDNMIFVSHITHDSIFLDTELELGDRVVSVNEMNFMTYADSNYAGKLIAKAAKAVTLVVEKGHTNFTIEINVNHGHSQPKDLSRHDKKPQGTKIGNVRPNNSFPSSNKSHRDEESSNERDIDVSHDSGGALAKILSKISINKSKTPPKAAKPTKFKSGKPKATKPVAKIPKATRTKAVVKQSVVESSDSDESSLGDFASNERSAHSARSAPKSQSQQSLSKLNQGSLSRSIMFQFDDYTEDYMKVTVKKKSEDDPGIYLEKTEGKFLLTAFPDHESRLIPGMQVLAINGTVNINTVIKAEDLMKRRKGEVALIVDFSSPIIPNVSCPCCGEKMTNDGKHLNGISKKLRGRGRGDEASVTRSVAASLSDSVNTTQVSNRSPFGTRVPSIPEKPSKYKIDDYDSDSDGSDEEEKSKKTRRSSTSRYQQNDKFMVRVTKSDRSKEAGISLYEHKGVIYVSKVDVDSLFFSTPIKEGDKVLSVNGRKVSLIKSAANALGIIEERDAISLFVLRPDPKDKDYQEAVSQFPA